MPVEEGLQDQAGGRLVHRPLPAAPGPPLLHQPPLGFRRRQALVHQVDPKTTPLQFFAEAESPLRLGSFFSAGPKGKAEDDAPGAFPFGDAGQVSCEGGAGGQRFKRMGQEPEVVGHRHTHPARPQIHPEESHAQASR